MIPGSEISIRIDQTLTQDALGTMTYLEFEAMGVERVKTKLSVSYVDHLMLQEGFENSDDHKYLSTVAAKYGVLYSRPGNGICHQVHLERLTRPGWTLLGTDSHTPTAGAVGMLAIGAGGLDVAVAMAGGPFYLAYPKIVRVNLHGKLNPWATAKDVILELLKIMTTKGNVGTVLEYGGEGIRTLSVPERATLTNMGAEAGVTTSVFPSDQVTRAFFRAQGREADWVECLPDPEARYDHELDLDLGRIEPNIALPHSPDKVKRIKDVAGIPVDQVLIGSCTNSSYRDLMTAAAMLKGKKAHPAVSFGVAPGTRQVLRMISANGALTDFVDAGARILEPGCGFCVGNGQSPHSGAVSVRTNNRNFEGRSGTRDAKVYLVSPESAVAAALTGKITDPRDLAVEVPVVQPPKQFFADSSLFIPPTFSGEVFRGPNMGKPPCNTAMPQQLRAVVTVKLGDQVTTDHIIPAGSVGRYRSNIEKSSAFVFKDVAPGFAQSCEAVKASGRSSVIVAGVSYGQGSSREHAAICPMFLGVRAVIAKSIERIHMANLINFGIMPLIFENPEDYDRIRSEDELQIDAVHDQLPAAKLHVANRTQQMTFGVYHSLTPRQVEIVLSGGLLNHAARK
ncbi:MAG: aconitate hydratase [Desulfobacterales bacterium]|nr:aconitate hydratase [Desulfobacterales bacterium]